jgi:hypothetical protein
MLVKEWRRDSFHKPGKIWQSSKKIMKRLAKIAPNNKKFNKDEPLIIKKYRENFEIYEHSNFN